jgi:hypothetical protein
MSRKTSKGVNALSGTVANVVLIRNWRRLGTRVHHKKVGSADVLAFQLQRGDDPRPGAQRNTPTLPPLGDCPVTLTNVRCHGDVRRPHSEEIIQGHTVGVIEVDVLSSQARPIGPVTAKDPYGTIRPVGRAASPSSFKREVAKRLEAARVAAGFSRQEDFAKLLGCGLDAYRKYEQGRTVLPAHYLPRFRDLTGKDANYLFDTPPMAATRKSAAA